MSKYTKQFKVTVVEHYLSGTEGLKLVSKSYGIAHTLLSRWVAMYRLRGVDGLDKKFSHYDARFKFSVLQHMREHKLSYTQTELLFDLRGTGCVRIWEKRYDSGGIEALVPRNCAPHKTMTTTKTKKRRRRLKLTTHKPMMICYAN